MKPVIFLVAAGREAGLDFSYFCHKLNSLLIRNGQNCDREKSKSGQQKMRKRREFDHSDSVGTLCNMQNTFTEYVQSIV